MEAIINIKLVERFVASIRKRGEMSLPSSLSSVKIERMSTPFLAWVFSNRNITKEENEIEYMYKLDQSRGRFVVGHSIFEDENLTNYPGLECMYLEARKIISAFWGEYDQLIEVVAPRVSLLPRENFKYESSSDPKTFGEIIFNMEHPCVLRWVEILIHEVGHMYLNVLLATTPMNPDMKKDLSRKKFSNIRSEERPLIGIVHGVFVQALMMTMASKVIKNSTNADYLKGAWRTVERFKKSFSEDYNTIQDEKLRNIVSNFSAFVNEGFECLNELEEVHCEV